MTAHSGVLRDFADEIQHTAARGTGNTAGFTDGFMTEVRNWCKAMKPVVGRETVRVNKVVEHLQSLFKACDLLFNYKVYRSTQGSHVMADIVLVPAAEPFVSVMDGPAPDLDPPCAIIEVKGERGSSGDPWPQLVTYYTNHVTRNRWETRYSDGGESNDDAEMGNASLSDDEFEMDDDSLLSQTKYVYDVWHFPVILTAVDGPNVYHGAGVIGMEPIVQQLSASEQHFEKGSLPKSSHLSRVAANLRAWINAIHALAAQYRERRRTVAAAGTDGIAADMQASLVFPEVCVDGDAVVFLEHLARGTLRASWKGTAVVVKICEYYNDAAQQWAANGDPSFAAKILHTELLRGYCGEEWRIIVMEDLWVQGFETLATARKMNQVTEGDKEGIITKGVKQALTRLHARQWVFFDLRAPNVMVQRRDEGGWNATRTSSPQHA